MKERFFIAVLSVFIALQAYAQSANDPIFLRPGGSKLYLYVHQVELGGVDETSIREAHELDLALEEKYGVNILKYWINLKEGLVFYLATADDSSSIISMHIEANGFLPAQIHEVKTSMEALPEGGGKLFLEFCKMPLSRISVKGVEETNKKLLMVEKKHGVHLIGYWIDVQAGLVIYLKEAHHSSALVVERKEAHLPIPLNTYQVQEGQ